MNGIGISAQLGDDERHPVRHQAADEVGIAASFAVNVMPVMQQIRTAGATSYAAIASTLNARGIHTARGGEWHSTTVRNILLRQQVA